MNRCRHRGSGDKVVALINVWFYCFKFDILGNHAAVRNLMNDCNFIRIFLNTLAYMILDFIDFEDLILVEYTYNK